jgi:hypothetical protein
MSLPNPPSAPAMNPNLQSVFDEAVKVYDKKTKGNITSHPLLAELRSCKTVDGILAVIHRRDGNLRAPRYNLDRFLIPIIDVLCKVTPFIGNVVSHVSVKFLIRSQFAKSL